ncbi:hypothetical protein B0T10DRAFT_591770 [Thelonectria olida]|uniref:NACHT domain-containing protein n=1 Tax=Thelonectria olida TaxID=1576542 RepID=A0A9P8W9F1_9HYPO|nr:hypothetical protein B0T10DRAFT_591770 [Thelonectria olida]
MATGIESLGAASAVLQVISFAGDVACVCKKVYDGKPTANDELQEHARRMSDAAGRIQSRCQTMAETQSSEYDKKLGDIAQDCRTAARELENEVSFVTDMHKKGSLLKAVNAAFRASSHRRKIERLELSLFRCRQVMETEIMSHLCSRSDAIELQQRQDFGHLAEDVQSLVAQVARGHTKLEDLVRGEHDVTRDIVVQETVKIQGAINTHVTTEIQTLGTNAGTKAQHKSFLQSLKFPEMNQRYNDLMNSRNASFKRVFASYKEMTNQGDGSKETPESKHQNPSTSKRGRKETDQAWAQFVGWLQSSDSLFCIRGKPGSGKSTLVKFIIDNKNTRQLLCRWSPEVTIISHFFWKIGSLPQNSIKGLLCSLVYQSLAGNEELTEHILDLLRHLSSNTYYHDWSTQDLKTVFSSILEKDTRHTCIFIDGLDEICNKDGLFELTQTIEEMLKFPNIKMCVTSRPETLVMGWLKKRNVPGVLLEDLTRPDMRTFVYKELEPFLSSNAISTKTHETLTRTLVQKAQGVFLWLHLATRSLVTGIQNEDSEEMLLARLEELPSELQELYAGMWQRLNENNSIYRETAARYFRYALRQKGLIPMFPEVGFPSGYPEVQQPTLFQIACAESVETQEILLTGTDAIDAADMQRLCEKTKLAIQNRCAGLLRVRSPSMRGRMIEILGKVNDLDLPRGTEDVDDGLFGGVVFIHRTAHDFLSDTETGQDILKCGLLSENGVEIRLLKGLLCLLRFFRSEYGVMGRSTSIFYKAIQLSQSQSSEGLQEAIEVLQVVQNLYNNKVIGADRPQWQPQAPFLNHLTDHAQFDDFVISSLARANSTALATDVLREAWDPDLSLRYNRGRAPSARLVEALLSMGADAHAYGVNRKQEMGRMEPFARQGTAFTNLLMSGIGSVNEGEHLGGDSAHEMLKAAASMATTCPDLSATTLVIGRVNSDGETSMMNVTWLSRPQSFIKVDSAWLLYEVDLKFLLLCLLSGFAVGIDEDALGGAQVDELLPWLESPSAKIRLIVTCDEESKALVCYRVPSHLEAPEMTECLFASDADLRTSKSAYKCVMDLMGDASVERVDLESEVLSMADEGLGFCTLAEAGILPTPSFVDHLEKHMPEFALTIERLRVAVSSVGNDVTIE